jgi:hypothetical protein
VGHTNTRSNGHDEIISVSFFVKLRKSINDYILLTYIDLPIAWHLIFLLKVSFSRKTLIFLSSKMGWWWIELVSPLSKTDFVWD